MKKILLLVFLAMTGWLCSPYSAMSQGAGGYSSTTATDATLEDMSSGTTNLLTVAYHDDDASAVTNIGFTFTYCGTGYTQFSANSNGQLRLGATAISGTSASPASGVPLIIPISGDNAIMATGKLHYKVTGTSPNQILVVEWNMIRIPFGSTGTGGVCQALLYETSGKIEFRYGVMYNNSTSTSSRGVCISSSNVAGANGNWTTITTTPTYTTTATGITTTSFAASSSMTNLNGTVAGQLRRFTFLPPVPCAGQPTPGATLSTANPVCVGLTFTLSLQNNTTGTGVTYQWETSPTGSDPWTPATGATLATYAATQAATTWYHCKVTCANSGLTGTSDPLQVTMMVLTPPTTAEAFEGSTFPPTCWFRYSGLLAAPSTLTSTTSGWIQDDWRNVTSPVNKAARLNIYGTTCNYWLTTPLIDLGSTNPMQLEFDLSLVAYGTSNPPGTTGTDDKFAVVISTDGGVTWTSANTLRLWDNAGSAYVYNNINTLGEHVILPLSAYSGIIKLAFYGESTVSNADNDLMVDNVTVIPVPACPAPYSLQAATTSLTATLSWSQLGSPVSWDLEYGKVPYTFTGTPTVYGITNPYTLYGLDPSSSYVYKVKANCSDTKSTSEWSTSMTFNTKAECPAPTGLTITGTGTNYARMDWTQGGTETYWNVEVGAPGFTPGTGTALHTYPLVDYNTDFIADGLNSATDYNVSVQAVCGLGDAMVGKFWMAQDAGGALQPGSGSTLDPQYPGQDGIWRQYTQPISGGLDWYNTWFYNAPFDNTRMKIIKMGFWIQKLVAGQPANVRYVVNWSNENWIGEPTYPMPAQEAFINRSELNGPITVADGDAQWIEMEYVIPYYNPEWVSVDVWGYNIAILNNPMMHPPIDSPLYQYWMQTPNQGGGVIVHQCVPKPIGTTSGWTPNVAFATSCGTIALPYCQAFPLSTFPACWTQDYTGAVTSNRWSMSNSAVAGGTAYEAMNTFFNGIGTSSLYSPIFNTAGRSQVKLSFRQMYNDYGAGCTMRLRVRWDGGAWTDIWTYASGSGDIPARLDEYTLPVTGNTLEVSWMTDGNLYQYDYWYIDDVCLAEPLAHDAMTLSVDVGGLIPAGTFNPRATVKNNGTTDPESFNVTMTAPGGYSSTKNVTLATGASTQVIFDPWTPGAGANNVQVCTQLATDQDLTNDCKSKSVTVDPALVYCYVAYGATSGLPEGPGCFHLATPGTITSLGSTTSDQFICAGTWANGTWYVSEYYDPDLLDGGGWWTIDPYTGSMTKIGDYDIGFPGIAYNKSSGVMYGVNYNDVTLYTELYSINPATGEPTLITGTLTTDLLINLAADPCNGNLYALGLDAGQLYVIDPTVPSITVVGSTGLAINYGQDMEMDANHGVLYAAAYTTSGALYTINRTTGTATLVGAFPGGAEICGFAIPYTPTTPMSAGSVVTNASCPTASDGAINVTVTGGLAPYAFAWSSGQTTEDLSGIPVGDYTVVVTDASGCTTTTGGSVGYTSSVCNYSYPEGTVTTSMCYDAHITITTAGPGKTFLVQAPTGYVRLISAGNILMLEGTHCEPGAYLHAYISTTFCDGIPPPLPSMATTVNEVAGIATARFTLYPNPTSGNFILSQNGERICNTVRVEVYSMSGSRVMTEQMVGEKQHEFGFSDIPFGMYFVKIVADNYVETIKLIKTR